MQAYLTVNTEDVPITKGPMAGYIMPYMTKDGGVPLFTFTTDAPLVKTTPEGSEPMQQIIAQPGMVGMGLRGELYIVGSDKEVMPLPMRLIRNAQYDQFMSYISEGNAA